MEDQNTNERSTKEQKSKGLSRRNLVKGVAATSVITTLTAKSSLASANICTISGFGSVNPSGVRHEVEGCGGIEPGGAYSPGGWGHPDNGQGDNTDGNRTQWYDAGCYPNPREDKPATKNKPAQVFNDPDATLFNEIFTSGRTDSLHDAILDESNQLDRHAAANYLNAKYFNWDGMQGRISSSEIVRLHYAASNGHSSYTNDQGFEVNIAGIDVEKFFDNLYH